MTHNFNSRLIFPEEGKVPEDSLLMINKEFDAEELENEIRKQHYTEYQDRLDAIKLDTTYKKGKVDASGEIHDKITSIFSSTPINDYIINKDGKSYLSLDFITKYFNSVWITKY